jgi:hypothetical protein
MVRRPREDNIFTEPPRPSQREQVTPPVASAWPFNDMMWTIAIIFVLLLLFFNKTSSAYVDSCIDYCVDKFEAWTSSYE